jgi:hypothetical protein
MSRHRITRAESKAYHAANYVSIKAALARDPFIRDRAARKRFHISGLIYEASKREHRRSLAVLVRYRTTG